jgi:hypothetical protein
MPTIQIQVETGQNPFTRACAEATMVVVHKADVSFTYHRESEEVVGIVGATFRSLGLPDTEAAWAELLKS